MKRYYAHIEVEYEAEDIEAANDYADQLAAEVGGWAYVTYAWVNSVEEST